MRKPYNPYNPSQKYNYAPSYPDSDSDNYHYLHQNDNRNDYSQRPEQRLMWGAGASAPGSRGPPQLPGFSSFV